MKVLFLLLFISGCSLYFSGKDSPKTAKGVGYSIPFSMPNWELKKDKNSDYVYEHQDGRILLSNSFCNEFQEQPLDRLARKTFNSISEFQETAGSYTTFHDREAFRLDGSGSVDGVKVNLRLLNTRRNNCYFDFLSISPAKTSDDGEAFKIFLQAVRFP